MRGGGGDPIGSWGALTEAEVLPGDVAEIFGVQQAVPRAPQKLRAGVPQMDLHAVGRKGDGSDPPMLGPPPTHNVWGPPPCWEPPQITFGVPPNERLGSPSQITFGVPPR